MLKFNCHFSHLFKKQSRSASSRILSATGWTECINFVLSLNMNTEFGINWGKSLTQMVNSKGYRLDSCGRLAISDIDIDNYITEGVIYSFEVMHQRNEIYCVYK